MRSSFIVLLAVFNAAIILAEFPLPKKYFAMVTVTSVEEGDKPFISIERRIISENLEVCVRSPARASTWWFPNQSTQYWVKYATLDKCDCVTYSESPFSPKDHSISPDINDPELKETETKCKYQSQKGTLWKTPGGDSPSTSLCVSTRKDKSGNRVPLLLNSTSVGETKATYQEQWGKFEANATRVNALLKKFPLPESCWEVKCESDQPN